MENVEGIVEGGLIKPTQPGKGRKKKRNPDLWQKNVAKKRRHCAKAFPKKPMCKHNGRLFKCSELSMQDIRRMNQNFYSEADRHVQNEFILKFVTIETPKRKRSRMNIQEKEFSVKYFCDKKQNGVVSRVRVCKKTFTETLGVSGDRVKNLCKKYFLTGLTPTDKRGGDTRSRQYEDKRKAVKAFIESINSVESHYMRGKDIHRQYLSSDLSIAKLHNLYNENNPNLKVNYEYFRTIFCEDYNIGFGSPATDVCSYCLVHKENLKLPIDIDEKNRLKAELTLHNMKAKAFYDYLRFYVEGEKVISFDCQKNLIVPKLPDQSAYYLRQMYLYNLTICEGLSTESQTKHNTFCYTWLEHEYPKGSNQIASAVFHRLCNMDLENVKTLKLVADGCGGQNKNTIMVGMACHWLLKHAPRSLEKIVLLFPVVGHSYIPPDRIFGRIEKKAKSKTTILNPEEYYKIFSDVATVFKLGEDDDVSMIDWKATVSEIIKKPANWHFKFQPSKRIILKKKPTTILVRGETAYNGETGMYKSVCRKGKSWQTTNPQVIMKGVKLKNEKLKDLNSLLSSHFGPNWQEMENLKFFKNVFELQAEMNVNLEEEAEDDLGEIPEDLELHV